MARRQDQLVDTIRQRRRQLGHELRCIVSWPALQESVRSRPLPWLLGGALAGWAGVRFLARPLWRDRKGLTRRWVRARLRAGVLALFLAGLREQRRAATPQPAARMDGPGGDPPRAPRRRETASAGGDGLGAARR